MEDDWECRRPSRFRRDQGDRRRAMGRVQTIESGTNVIVTLNGDSGTISAGGKAAPIQGQKQGGPSKGQNGELFLYDEAGNLVVGLSASPRHLYFRTSPPAGQFTGAIKLVVDAETPDIRLFGPSGGGASGAPKDATVYLHGHEGLIRVGGSGVNGRMHILDGNGNARVKIDGSTGDIVVPSSNGSGSIKLEGSTGDIVLRSSDGSAKIRLEGNTGDIILANADCAEEFDIADPDAVEPGTVMVLDNCGQLQQSREAYDKKVAGVISGAGDFRPGIILDRRGQARNRMPLALVGKAFCKADAQYGSIRVGDLLTTSLTGGHAMKAIDPQQAFGAVLGKALRPLECGKGLIPILISLQ
jgi:hypothetical protein